MEAAFRTLKSPLMERPTFHQLERPTRHFSMCKNLPPPMAAGGKRQWSPSGIDRRVVTGRVAMDLSEALGGEPFDIG